MLKQKRSDDLKEKFLEVDKKNSPNLAHLEDINRLESNEDSIIENDFDWDWILDKGWLRTKK